MLYYYQKHGENLESDPPAYGCLHPKWQKQHKDKQLSREELSRLWQIEQCNLEPINPKSSHHMTSLDKWTVSACHSNLHILVESLQKIDIACLQTNNSNALSCRLGVVSITKATCLLPQRNMKLL